MGYREQIKAILERDWGARDVDPAHVEAWMRLERGTLDGLDARQFAREVGAALECVDLAPREHSGRLAESYGLVLVRRD